LRRVAGTFDNFHTAVIADIDFPREVNVVFKKCLILTIA